MTSGVCEIILLSTLIGCRIPSSGCQTLYQGKPKRILNCHLVYAQYFIKESLRGC